MTGEQKLRLGLRANAAFSVATGTIGLLAAGRVVDVLGTGSTLLVRLGSISLLAFAGFVFWVSARPLEQLRSESLLISAGDIGWVLGSVVLIALGLFSTSGTVATAIIAAIVTDLALFQLWSRSKTVSE